MIAEEIRERIAVCVAELRDLDKEANKYMATEGWEESEEFMDLLDRASDIDERIEILELELDYLEEQAYDSVEDEGSTLD